MTRPTYVRRVSSSLLILLVVALATLHVRVGAEQARPASSPIATGVVVDEQGSPIVRARVRAIDGASAEIASAFTDERGRFTIASARSCASCRVEASLAGFLTVSTTVAGEARLVLSVAPVRESVVVTPNRDEAPTSQVGSTVTVFTRADIDRRGEPVVAELLRESPGVTVVRTGGYGGVTSIFVRGGEGDYNKVLLDGIPINDPGGAFDFSNLTTGGIDRIELVRGAQSALFGSDAMASVVQLVSSRGRTDVRPQASFLAEGGSYGTSRFEAGVSGGLRRWNYALSGGRFDTDNREPNNAFENLTFTGNTGGPIDAAGTMSLRALVRTERQQVGVPGQTGYTRPDMDSAFDRDQTMAGVSFERRVTGAWRQQAAFSVTDALQTSTNLIADPPAFSDFTYDTQNDFRRYHLSYQSDWRFGAPASMPGSQTVTAAFDYDGERATLADRMAQTSLDASRDNVGVSIQHQFTTTRLFTTAGLRFEHNDSFGGAVVPRVSVAFVARQGSGDMGDTTIRGSAGLGVKEPTIIESYSQNFYFLGNPDLKPERSRTFDAGVEQRLFDQRAKIELMWFDGTYRDQIATRTVDPTSFAGQFFNIGRTRARGLEISADVAPLPGLRARTGYTFLASEIVEVDATAPPAPPFEQGAWAFRRPRHSGFVDLSATRGKVSVDLSGVFSGRRTDSDFFSAPQPVYESNLPAVWSLRGRYDLTKQLELFLRIENLTDADYMDPLGYPAWARSTHGGVRVRF